MTAEDPVAGPAGGAPEATSDLLGQLSEILGRIGAAAGCVPGMSSVVGRLPALPEIALPSLSLPRVPLPGALSASQVEAVMSAVRAQRATIAATRISLDAFEQQLMVLEELLEPVAAVTRQWAAVERHLAGGAERDDP